MMCRHLPQSPLACLAIDTVPLAALYSILKTIEGIDEECAAGALKETRHQVEHDISETRGSRDQVVRRARAVVCAIMRQQWYSVTRAMNARELMC